MGAPVRTCVACRTRHPAEALLRLGVGGDGRIGLAPASRGRGAWVCPRRECLGALASRPRGLSRALRLELRPEQLAGLKAEALDLTWRRCRQALQAAAAAGSLQHGAARIAALSADARVVAVVVATDASQRARDAADAIGPGLPCADVGLDRVALGRLVNRGPRAAIAVLDGKPGNALALQLRRALAIS